ncbi:type I DNA topoisomerase [Sphingomicrobium arenosum]|uniref:type I DNA topoisomerase n=1 Tax=Sphingomicrobium arenosum TaxID=2233861 RepID=UPI002240F58E|nr:type I DNA topoisomerase [Sphingomicrobium arenosum]
MKLVIVESPAKAKTIEKYLGPGHKVLASYGHVRDLPAKDGSVEPDDGFAMKWAASADKTKQLKAITDAAKEAETLILATDPDREGEAISWHVQEVLTKRKALPADTKRVTFNQITKSAVTEAMASPRDLDTDLIDAYLARRALDYLVGFTLSPILWRKLPGARSAGRVQSVALRLIVDREREIEVFEPREYWQLGAVFEQEGTPFESRLVNLDGKKIDRLTIGNKGDADAAKAVIEAGNFTVESVEQKPLTRNPPPPFTTSTLQQEAARKLGYSASHTMSLAQGLYEAGAITYMRTDGVTMAGEALAGARHAIADRYDAGYLPDKPRQYKSKQKNAQEAHEAIRPTNFRKDRAGSGDAAKLYTLIYNRALASQMAAARLERTTVELSDGAGRATLRATGQVVKFPGYLALYEEGRDDAADEEAGKMPLLREGDAPMKREVTSTQHFTQPPPRFSEASLVKRLEELGIGRPSTYAATLQTLKDRDYVRLEQKRFVPEDSGRLVTAFLERFFDRYVSYDYTASLEEELDDVSGGRMAWQSMLEAFWRDFKPKAGEVMEQKPSDITAALDEFLEPYLFPAKDDGTDPRACPKDGGQLSLRGGKFGAFIACANYPECNYTRPFGLRGEAANDGPQELGEGIELKTGRFGPYLEQEVDGEKKRASIPKDVDRSTLDLVMAKKLLSLPREIGDHPETGKPISASIGRYGPYLLHDGNYARLKSTEEVFETGMNAAVAKLAEAAAQKGQRGGRQSREPIAVLGKHPTNEAEVKVMDGRYGPYVTDGTTNATLPKGTEPKDVSLEQAVQLIDERAAKGPAKKKRKAPAKKKAAPKKKAAAKKPAAKKS